MADIWQIYGRYGSYMANISQIWHIWQIYGRHIVDIWQIYAMADPDISGESLQLWWMAASEFSFQPAKAIASRDVRQTLVNLHLNSSRCNSGLW